MPDYTKGQTLRLFQNQAQDPNRTPSGYVTKTTTIPDDGWVAILLCGSRFDTAGLRHCQIDILGATIPLHMIYGSGFSGECFCNTWGMYPIKKGDVLRIRFLPTGVRIGDGTPNLSVLFYPFAK